VKVKGAGAVGEIVAVVVNAPVVDATLEIVTAPILERTAEKFLEWCT